MRPTRFAVALFLALVVVGLALTEPMQFQTQEQISISTDVELTEEINVVPTFTSIPLISTVPAQVAANVEPPETEEVMVQDPYQEDDNLYLCGDALCFLE